MSDEPTRDLDTRTPTVEGAALYWQWGGHMWQAPERFDRMISKVKADALRSTARAFEAAEVNLDVIPAKDRELWRGRNEQRAASVASLRARADRLEDEARLACAAGIGTSSERSSK